VTADGIPILDLHMIAASKLDGRADVLVAGWDRGDDEQAT
jgi:hypothetical protein